MILDDNVPHRGTVEMLMSIIESTSHKPKPTQIMWRSNLNGASFKVYMSKLLENKLIEKKTLLSKRAKCQINRYYLTSRGVETLNTYKELKHMLNGNGGETQK